MHTDTRTLSWEYHYSGIRLVGLCGGGTVILEYSVSRRGVEVQNTVSGTTGVARVVEVLTTYMLLLPLTTHR